MSDRTKKIIFIVVFIALTLLLGYLLYFIFLRPTITPTTTLNNVNEGLGGGLPTAGQNLNRPIYINVNGKLVPSDSINTNAPSTVSDIATGGLTNVKTLNNVPTMAAKVDATGDRLVYYNKNDGKFYRIDADGNATLLSDKVFSNVETVTWSNNAEKAVLEYPDGANIVYNFTTEKQVTLPKQWKDFSFSPTDDKLVFKNWTVDREDRYLSTSNDDGSGFRRIETLGTQDDNVHVDWSPNKQIIATFNESIDLERQYLYFIGQNKERFNISIVEGHDFRQKWSPGGNKLLYSVYHTATDLNPSLWIVDAKGDNMGENRQPLNIPTWADKCTFADANTVYCAVPKELERGSGLVPEYAANVPDDFYRIDVNNGSKSLIAVPNGDYNAENISVSEDGKYLYFIDTFTGQLKQLQLK